MVCDSLDYGFQILNDIERVREESVEEENDLNIEVEADTGLSLSEASASLETALKWMERQPECDQMQLFTVKWMRNLAAQKRIQIVLAYLDQDVQQAMNFIYSMVRTYCTNANTALLSTYRCLSFNTAKVKKWPL